MSGIRVTVTSLKLKSLRVCQGVVIHPRPQDVDNRNALTINCLSTFFLYLPQQENEIVTRENRNFFSLHCIHLETQLVYLNMQILSEVVATLVATQIKGHREVSNYLAFHLLMFSILTVLSSTYLLVFLGLNCCWCSFI